MGNFIIVLILFFLVCTFPVLLVALIFIIPVWLYVKNKASNDKPIGLSTHSRPPVKRDYTSTKRITPTTGVTYNPPPEIVKSRARTQIQWAGLSETIEVANFVIQDPLVYWTEFDQSLASREASCILKSAKVSKSIPDEIEGLGYWPTYSNASPSQRAYYLKWLATGKKEPLEEIGYAFLYFYGLEHRALVEKRDIPLIIDETLRLLETYPFSNSFNGYLSSFITYLVAREQATEKSIEARTILDRLPKTYNEILLEIKLLAKMGETPILGSDLAYEVTKADQRASNSVVVKRVNEQFRQLFERRFFEKFPSGMELSASSQRSFKHHPASPTLLYNTNAWQTLTVPNILGSKKQFTPLVKIWNDCIEELRPLSRVAQKGIDLSTKEAFQALPEELKGEFDHPDKPKWENLIAEYAREDGLVIVPISKLVQSCINPQWTKLTLKQSKDLAQTADDMQLSIVPDARLISRVYGWDDLVVLLKNDQIAQQGPSAPKVLTLQLEDLITKASNTDSKGRYELLPDNINHLVEIKAELQRLKENTNSQRSERSIYNKIIFAIDKKLAARQGEYNYELALVMLELGMVVAAADSKIDPEELQHISEFLESQFRLNQHDIRKLEAYQEILKLQPPNLSALVRKLKTSLTLDQLELLLQFLVGIAAANGIVVQKEIAVLRKIYTAFGIDVEKLNSVLWNLQNDADEPVEVKQGKPKALGEPIPPQSEARHETKVLLNEEYLRQILDETSKVTSILANALMEAEAENSEIADNLVSQEKDPVADISNDERLAALDKKYHQVLAELIILAEWKRQEFQSLAKKHGLMPASMIEIINTWSDEHLGDFLIEDGMHIRVNKHLLENVK